MENDDKVFTPLTQSGDRLRLKLSDGDFAKIRRGGPWTATVTDLPTGTVYDVRGAACDLGSCFCDAVVIRIATGHTCGEMPESILAKRSCSTCGKGEREVPITKHYITKSRIKLRQCDYCHHEQLAHDLQEEREAYRALDCV